MRALVMGRFQPFHLGHLRLVRTVLSGYDEVIIAITSSQFNYLEKDPFTAGERAEMIRRSLKGEGLDLARCMVMQIENQPNISTWASYLKSVLPPFDTVVSGNRYVGMLLADSGIEVSVPEMHEREKFEGSGIRRMMAQGGPWEYLVPPAAAAYMQEIGGPARIKVITDSDTRPTEH
ncbi:nicotinamide mononucleotide adenylyltransferase [Cenarchaeum symbiosum A]|uniref:Nicotinamide-nucleotide adenylyltransferase n=1 Tax=Cenarchaeum symbiosum (strain A) TaxID=414004 RepID=A0RXE2_CENSY|nr:nicotinamide mononucleotide adenylyltransferase [Cenarchaeum symbiosum A]